MRQISLIKVRVPEERIKMYTEYTIPPNSHPKVPEGLHKLAGPFDIALIKMRVGVTLMPGRLVPVGQIVKLFLGIFLFLRRHALAASRTKECKA